MDVMCIKAVRENRHKLTSCKHVKDFVFNLLEHTMSNIVQGKGWVT